MDDVFISYASDDRERVRPLAQALESRGLSVWWDREIPAGAHFDEVIEAELNRAGCVVVLWSASSVKSRWVRAESSAALERDRLVPARLDDAAVPLEFRRIQTADLTGWSPGEPSAEFDGLVQSVERLLGRGSAARASTPSPRPPGTPAAQRPRDDGLRAGRFRRLGATAAGLVALLLAIGLWTNRERIDASDPPAGQVERGPGSATEIGATGSAVPAAAHEGATANGQARPTDPSPASGPPGGGAATGVPPSGAPAGAAAAGTIAIKLGERIEEGVPAPGAGVVAAPFAETHYVFEAPADETIFARVRKVDDDLRYVQWRLVDASGKEIFKACLACGQPGVLRLREGGRYTLVVGGGDGKTGTYSVQLTRVPAPDRFAVELAGKPVRVGEGAPARGAGVIEAPGARDAYGFSVEPNARVGIYLVGADDAMNYIEWRLEDADGDNVFKACLRCGHPGVFVLRKGGLYTLWVGGNADPATGAYALQIASVPPPSHFDLGALGASARVAPGIPAAGAGEIETLGAADTYRFSVAPRTKIGVRLNAVEKSLRDVRLRIADEDGGEVYDSCLACGDPGALDLVKGGTYTMTVHSRTEPVIGTYEVLLSRL